MKKLTTLLLLEFALCALSTPALPASVQTRQASSGAAGVVVATQAVGYIDLLKIPKDGTVLYVGNACFLYTDDMLHTSDCVKITIGSSTLGEMTDKTALAINLRTNTLSTASSDGVSQVTLTAINAGSAGNSITLSCDNEDDIFITPFSGGTD